MCSCLKDRKEWVWLNIRTIPLDMEVQRINMSAISFWCPCPPSSMQVSLPWSQGQVPVSPSYTLLHFWFMWSKERLSCRGSCCRFKVPSKSKRGQFGWEIDRKGLEAVKEHFLLNDCCLERGVGRAGMRMPSVTEANLLSGAFQMDGRS